MAKVAFSKLEAKVCDSSQCLSYCNTKGEKIQYEVKYYLPVEKKMEMISNIINQSIDNNGYYNPIKIKIFTVLEVVYAYTNLNFTDKQKENVYKLYDQFMSTGLFSDIKEAIWEEDWKEIEEIITIMISNIYEYKNSVMGVLESVQSNYNSENLNLLNLQDDILDSDSVSFLKEILNKLG